MVRSQAGQARLAEETDLDELVELCGSLAWILHLRQLQFEPCLGISRRSSTWPALTAAASNAHLTRWTPAARLVAVVCLFPLSLSITSIHCQLS